MAAGLISCPHPAWGHDDRFVSRFKSSITFSPVTFVRVGAPEGEGGGRGGETPDDRFPSADRQWASRAAALPGAWTRGWGWKGSSANQFQDRALPDVFGLTEDDYADAAGGRVRDRERSTRQYDVREALVDTGVYTDDNLIDAYDVTESCLAENAQQGAWSVGVLYALQIL